MEIRKRIRIGVIGGANPDRKARKWARTAGRLIAENGAVLVCGGLGGVMEEAAAGAKERGGITVGILPGSLTSDANPHIDLPIATGMGYTRNALVVMNADVLIAIDGEYGTLSEIAYACVQEKKVFGLGTWDIPGIIPVDTPEEAVAQAISLSRPSQ